MAKFQSKVFTGQVNVPQPNSAEIYEILVPFDFPATAPAANDLIELLKLPAGVRCVDWAAIFPDIDTGGSPAFAFSLGVENTAGTDLGTEVWGTGLTAGQSTTVSRNTTSVAAQGDVSTDRAIAIKVTTAAATYAGAGKRGHVLLKLVG